MKYGNTFYLELTREIFTDRYKDLSINAKWLFVVLNELEHRYTGTKQNDFFIRSNKSLCEDTGMSLSTLKRAKAELVKTDLIETWSSHYIDKNTKKKSIEHYTAYKILK